MEATHIAAARAIVLRERPVHRRSRRRTVTGLLVAGALLAIPGLAMANALPPPAEHAVSNVLQKVGISVPANTEHPSPTAAGTHPPAGTHEHPATAGDHPASNGSVISTIATTTNATGVAKGAQISTIASGGDSQAGQHGKA